MTPVSEISISLASRETSSCAAVSLSPSGDSSKPRLRFDPVRAAFVSSYGQLLVSDSLASNRVDKAIQSLQSVTLHVARIQPESKFVNVSGKVFRAGVVIDARQSAFKNGPNTLNAVHVDFAASVNTSRVIDRAVSEEKTVKARVRSVFVSVERRTDFDIVEKALLNRAEVVGRNRETFGASVALAHTENDLLA